MENTLKRNKRLGVLSYDNAKTTKGLKVDGKEYRVAILYMASADNAGKEVCPFSFRYEDGVKIPFECRKYCLVKAGRGRFDGVKNGRARKKEFFFSDRKEFFNTLERDITRHIHYCLARGVVPVVRLNGTSDISYENMKVRDGLTIFQLFPDVQFYDYTKDFNKAMKYAMGELPSNYQITFSHDRENEAQAIEALRLGVNVAGIKGKMDALKGYDTIDGDKSDLRFNDKQNGSIVELKLKK
jgi:hypothetical protein